MLTKIPEIAAHSYDTCYCYAVTVTRKKINKTQIKQGSGSGEVLQSTSEPSRLRCLGIFILDHMTVGSVLNASRVTLLLRSQKGGIWVKDREAQREEGARGPQENNSINTCCLLCRQTSVALS